MEKGYVSGQMHCFFHPRCLTHYEGNTDGGGECSYGQQIPKCSSNWNFPPHSNLCKFCILDPSKLNHKLPGDRSWNTSGKK